MAAWNRTGSWVRAAVAGIAWSGLLISALLPGAMVAAQVPATNDPAQFGPYNGVFLADGLGLHYPIANTKDTLLRADSPWTLLCWVRPQEAITGRELVAGLGTTTAEYPRYLALDAGSLTLFEGEGNTLSGPARVEPGTWHLLAATFDGSLYRVYADGVAAASGTLATGSTNALLQMAPPSVVPENGGHFAGEIAGFTVLRRALSAQEIAARHAAPPDFAAFQFEEASKPWRLQTHAEAGMRAPQDPVTVPTSRAAATRPAVKKGPPEGESLRPSGADTWTLDDGWRLEEARKGDNSAALLRPGYDTAKWMRATVPGTVLTTMVDDGVYPDPDFGLNNLAIPESLNKHDYWYRNEFAAPASIQGKHLELTFAGTNYKAAIWLNGTQLGTVKGAFQRGTFDVSSVLKPGGKNVLAVRISPPPHPGIPHEQSVLGGPGDNGGAMLLDGPTFVATEGWDWIPAIRDRNSGIWQPVTLRATGVLKIGDAQVVTTFPGHVMTRAAVEVTVPVTNLSAAPVAATIHASFESVDVSREVTCPPGESVVVLRPGDFPQLNVDHPRLWWPNGYGAPDLYHMKLSVGSGRDLSDTKDVRFGMREITYELSLLDPAGHLRRVEYTPAMGRGASSPVVDVSHEGTREIPSVDAIALNLPEERRGETHTWVSSLTASGEGSPAIAIVPATRVAPYLMLRVNGVAIAARGGNWGMDDSRKRVSREHLEPFFRLHRDANLNIIRNWVGQNTEETFYELADEYGLLIWNDFWESTQDDNIEAEDPALFLANAADTIKHFRNHPSIAVWCGRNEGVPQPIISMGLDDLVRRLDGTRFYSPSSNQVNLQDSGPYSYRDPSLYYTVLNHGFSVELGTPSMSTLEAFEHTVAKEDRWPVDDAWAYHDWHQSGNGDVGSFMAEIEHEFGAPMGLEDFERKAQMLNYVNHRAIFEGMNAHLWAPNSGRMLWMTQPAWPSTMWQIMSSDYDTQASFYGVKKACEPLHVQLNLATYQVDVVNTTTAARPGLSVSAKVVSLDQRPLSDATMRLDATANATVPAMRLDLAPMLERGMVLVKLEVRDEAGKTLSQNLYWLGAKPASYRALTHLPATLLSASASSAEADGMVKVQVQLTNPSGSVSLENKLTLRHSKDKERILPAYYDDNYISLLPGETRTIFIDYPAEAASGDAEIALRGWNATPQTIPVKRQR